jgi:hypothetical protein
MDVALRRRLDGVAHISISQSRQTAEVAFAARRAAFSTVAFREAVGEADVEVLHFEVDVCGTVTLDGGQRWLSASPERILLFGGEWAAGQRVCLTGRLAEAPDRSYLAIESAQAIPDDGR